MSAYVEMPLAGMAALFWVHREDDHLRGRCRAPAGD